MVGKKPQHLPGASCGGLGLSDVLGTAGMQPWPARLACSQAFPYSLIQHCVIVSPLIRHYLTGQECQGLRPVDKVTLICPTKPALEDF